MYIKGLCGTLVMASCLSFRTVAANWPPFIARDTQGATKITGFNQLRLSGRPVTGGLVGGVYLVIGVETGLRRWGNYNWAILRLSWW
jgi:hypothetical protein